MKRPLAFLLIVILLQVSCRFNLPVKPTPTPALVPDPLSLPWEERDIFAPGLVPASQPILAKLPSASIYHLQLELASDLVHLKGHEEVHYTNAEEQPLPEIQFRLFPNILGGKMHIAEVLVDGKSITPNYGLNDSLLIVPLSTALQPGQSLTLDLDFTVTIPESLEQNYGVLAYAEGVLALAHAYPMIPVYNGEGWNAEIPPQTGDLTFADMAFFIVRITAPKDLTLVSVGRELSRKLHAEMQTVVFAAGPVRDYYLIASEDYQSVSKQAGDITVRFFAPKSHQPGARQALDYATRSIEDYSRRYVLFPYSEIDLAATPTLALGIEYPGMIAIADRILVPGSQFLEGTVAHEVAHQWFYNLVGNDQLDQPWLDESLAQFATLQYFTDQYGNAGYSGFKDSLEQRWQRVGEASIPIGLSVTDYTDQEYGAIVYGRGGLFFDALRSQMGTDKFDAFIKDYAATFSWEVATPEGLESLASKHCGCDLTSLFKEWVFP